MRRIVLLLSSLPIFAFASNLSAGDFRKAPWAEANIDGLRGADKAAVAAFINANLPPNWMEVPVYSVGESGWARVAGGKYNFLVPLDISGRGYSNALLVYSQDAAGKSKPQVIYGWKMGNPKRMVQDLNGDGQDEIVVPKELGPGGSWYPLVNMPGWPEVYRLKNGTYVEASRDFPNYYDEKVLPELDKEIRKAPNQDASAPQAVAKYKILRMLGRDPAAGLQEAYQWMNSDDPQLLQCAIATFTDIGGHEKELRSANEALKPAIQHELADRHGG